MRGGDDVVRAFANTCRHRGAKILSEERGVAGGIKTLGQTSSVETANTTAAYFSRNSGRHSFRQHCCVLPGKIVTCPYHAWMYTLKGELKFAPGMDEAKVAAHAPMRWLSCKLEQASN